MAGALGQNRRVRVVLGCMRPPTSAMRALVALALDGGVRDFDTARAYDGSEVALRDALDAAAVARTSVRVITKCGMTRPDGAWVPDGRRARILDDAERSADALGAPADLLLLHAPDPAVPIATSARALAEAKDRGLARAIGLSNVRRADVDAARAVARIEAIELSLGAYDDVAARSGLVRYALDLGLEVFAYGAFGGPAKKARLARDRALGDAARAVGMSPYRVLLAYLEALEPRLSIVLGPTREQTLLDCLSPGPHPGDVLAPLDGRFEGLATLRRRSTSVSVGPQDPREIVVAMGIAGAGKSSWAERWIREREARGEAVVRLNRDTLGGTIRGIARRLGEALAGGARAVILDNTYIGRGERADVLRVAAKHGARVRCVHFETSVEDALHNVALRMVRKHGGLVGPSEWRAAAKADPGLVLPGSIYRMARDLEPPTDDEGFLSIERIPFVRRPRDGRPGLVVSASAPIEAVGAALADTPGDAAILVLGFRPDGAAPTWSDDVERRARDVLGGRTFAVGLCLHGGGPPICYCRPPLPGLFVAFAEKYGVDARRTTFVTSSTSERTMATRLGAHA